MSSSGCHPGDFSPYNQQKEDRKGKSGEEPEHPLNFMQEKKKRKGRGGKKSWSSGLYLNLDAVG